ncbi:hypothetical protein AB0B25_06030 [Nocardia sp. NPDC049190]|uniref:hypothetical protein n=1 Tax=Nocardia sp. NPDC049190 TaxID=3155650 RepID=UPI0033C57F20
MTVRGSGVAGYWRSAFYTAPHYDGYAAVLVDLDRVAPDQLRELLYDARWLTAVAKVRTLRDGGPHGAPSFSAGLLAQAGKGFRQDA